METASSEAVYKFEGFVLDLVRGSLLDAKGIEVPLRAKSFDLLRLLLTNAGRLLDRDTINRVIWADVVVTDDAITQCIRDIRRVIGDSDQRLIKTVPRRGYLFAAKVTPSREQMPTVPTAEPLPLPDRPSIAVLPFANLSSDPEQQYFSDGIADDIITELSRDRALFVIARNSSFTYRGRSTDVKQVGRELGVRYIVEGSVRREAERVRVGAQLIDATTGDHVWAERYDRALEHVFAVQDEISEAVATAIRPAVGDAEQRRVLRKLPNSLNAWETYQRGLWHLSRFTSVGSEQARLLFQQAVEIDPGFALAHARLAGTYTNDALFHGKGPIAEAVQLAEAEARKAVAIDPNDSEAQTALATVFFLVGNYAAALDRVDRALNLNRNSASAHRQKGGILGYSGHCAEARIEMSISLRLDPHDPSSHHAASVIAASFYFEQDYAAAVGAARRSLADYPAFAPPCRFLVAALGQLGQQDEAAASLRRWMAAAPAIFDTMVRNRPSFVRPEDHEHLLDGLRKAGWRD